MCCLCLAHSCSPYSSSLHPPYVLPVSCPFLFPIFFLQWLLQLPLISMVFPCHKSYPLLHPSPPSAGHVWPDISDCQSNSFSVSCVWPRGVYTLPVMKTVLSRLKRRNNWLVEV